MYDKAIEFRDAIMTHMPEGAKVVVRINYPDVHIRSQFPSGVGISTTAHASILEADLLRLAAVEAEYHCILEKRHEEGVANGIF